MAHQYRLSKATLASIAAYKDAANEFAGSLDALDSDLLNEIQEHRDAAENASERWQESERADEVNAWIETIEAAQEVLTQLGELLGDFDPDSIENKA